MSDAALLLDHKEITDVAIRYCWALDTNDWAVLSTVFLPDATAHLGGIDLVGLDAIIARCSDALTRLDDSQHIVSNHQVAVDGDTATHRCYLHAQHVLHAAKSEDATGRSIPGHYVVAGRYEDRLVRTDEGWRIAHRDLIVMWREGNAAVMRAREDPTS